MSSNSSSDTGYLLDLITTDEKFHLNYEKPESEFTGKIRNSLNAMLFHLVVAGGITEEDVLEGMKQRDKICLWYTKMEHSREKSGQDTNPENRIEINTFNAASRFSPAPPPPSTEANDGRVDMVHNTASPQATLRAAQMNPNEEDRDHSSLCEIIQKKLDPDQWNLKPKTKSVRKLFGSKEVKTKIRDFMIEHVQFGFHIEKSKGGLNKFLDCIVDCFLPVGDARKDIMVDYLRNCAGQTNNNFGSVIQLMSEVHEKYCSEECVRTGSLGRFGGR